MSEVKGLGSFSSITDLKEIAANKDMPIMLKVSMFLNQLGLDKQSEAKTLIKDLDDTRNKATEYGNLANSLNNKIAGLGGDSINIGRNDNNDLKIDIALTDKLVKVLKELEGIYRGSQEGHVLGYPADLVTNLQSTAVSLTRLYGFDSYKELSKNPTADTFKKYLDIFELRQEILKAGPDFYGDTVPQVITKDKLSSMVDALKSSRETLMSTVQEKMVVIQDVMGQYNTFVQGSSSTLKKYADMAKSLTNNMR